MLLLLQSSFYTFAQDFPKTTEIFGQFVISDHWVQSQKFADSRTMDEVDVAEHYKNFKDDPNPPPVPPPPSVFDLRSNIHFIIRENSFIHYSIPNEFVNDSLVARGIYNIYKVDRKSLTIDEFSPNFFRLMEDTKPLFYRDQYLEIAEENYDNRKNILGYDCFQVILKENTGYLTELYVTEDLILEFHPVVNAKIILSKYYPLYIRRFDPRFPTDNYREYKFIKFH